MEPLQYCSENLKKSVQIRLEGLKTVSQLLKNTVKMSSSSGIAHGVNKFHIIFQVAVRYFSKCP
jgi:hypothetical protein